MRFSQYGASAGGSNVEPRKPMRPTTSRGDFEPGIPAIGPDVAA